MINKFGSDNRYTSMVLFEAFQEALRDLMTKDSWLFGQRKPKAAIAHALATHMQHRLREKLALSLDKEDALYLTLPKDLVFDIMMDDTDILLHDRNGKCVLAVMLFKDYLTKKEGDDLKKKNKPHQLTLGVTFLQGKPYLLIYRVNKETIDYYHYDASANASQLRMKKSRPELKDDTQLVLLKTRRRGKKKNEQPVS